LNKSKEENLLIKEVKRAKKDLSTKENTQEKETRLSGQDEHQRRTGCAQIEAA
jgi:hypothetical protein